MSDLDLRTAARHAALDGSPEARAALLRERLRAGELTQERVALAAYCGDEAAQQACGQTLGDLLLDVFPENTEARRDADDWGSTVMAQLAARPLTTMPFSVWVSGLFHWGHEAGTRAGVAAAKAARAAGAARDQVCCCGSSIESHDSGSGHSPVHACDYQRLPDCECSEWADPVRAIEAAEQVLGCPVASDDDPYRHQRMWDEGWEAGWRRHPWLPAPWASDGARAAEISSAARKAGEHSTRSAISSSLIAWALS